MRVQIRRLEKVLSLSLPALGFLAAAVATIGITVGAHSLAGRKVAYARNPAAAVTGITSLSMNPRNWNILYSVNMPAHPSSTVAGEWFFDFPQLGVGEIDYLTQNISKGSIVGSALVAQIEIQGTDGVIFDHYTEPSNTSTNPASTRFMIQYGTRLSSNQDTRWWSNPIAITLAPGVYELRVPLTPDQWTNINGQRADANIDRLNGFKKMLSAPSQIGFTFGGGYFFGHGVRVTNGKARMIVRGVRIE